MSVSLRDSEALSLPFPPKFEVLRVVVARPLRLLSSEKSFVLWNNYERQFFEAAETEVSLFSR